jgi:hypothetical protein
MTATLPAATDISGNVHIQKARARWFLARAFE